MLLYSLLHLAGVKAVDPDVRDAGRAGRLARRHQEVPPARQQVPRATPSTAGPPASRRPPARSARAWPPASAWPSPREWLAAHFNRAGLRAVRLRRLRHLRRRRHDGGRLRRGRLARRHLRLANLCWIYDNNRITIEGNTDLAFSEDVATRFLGYGWNVTRVGDANDLERARAARFETFKATSDRPDADHRRQPHRLRRAARSRTRATAHGEPLGEEEMRATKRIYGWPEDAQFLVPDGVREHFARRHRRSAAGELRARLGGAVRGVPGRASASWPTSSSGCSAASCPRAGTRACPTFPADAKGMATPRLLGQGAQRDREERALADRRLGRPRPVHQDPADLRRGRRLRAGDRTAAATSTSASASTPWAPSLNGLAPRKVRPYGSGFLSSATTSAAAIRLSRAHGDAGHPRLHPRLDRRRRGRPDAPAGRAARLAARDPGPDRPPPRPTPTRSPRPGG